jgi:hypothetical protein
MMRRVKNIAVGLDQFFWVLITLGHGSPDETVSAALWRMELQGKRAGRWFRPVVDALLWFDPEHYLAYPLFIGARAGTSLWFNGRLYSLVVRGAQSTTPQVEQTEIWINNKTKAY